MAVSLSSKIEFKRLYNLFEKISNIKGAKKYEELKKFTYDCRVVGEELKALHPETDTSLFPIFRLVLPNEERSNTRGPYGLKQKALAELYVKVFRLGANSEEAKTLTNHKHPNYDLSQRVYFQTKDMLKKDGDLTIEKVNQFLDEIANSNKNNVKKLDILLSMNQMSAKEVKWLTRILLKDLKISLQQNKVLEVLHPDAPEAFKYDSNFKNLCDRFSTIDSEDTNHEITVKVFAYVKPMLLWRLKWEHTGKLFSNFKIYYVQTKFDGERSQLHMKDGKFKYFTRNGYNIEGNAMYGETASTGRFMSSNIAQMLNPNCQSIILDGELMGWHKTKKKFGAKAQSFDVKKLVETSKHQPCFVAYDILLYNDEVVIDKPYTERLKILETAFTDKEGVIVHCNTTTVTNTDQLLHLFNESLANNDEGLVIKVCNGPYSPNEREKSGCYKLKAEYSDKLVQDLDLLILGGEYGQGRHSGMINSYVVGAASPSTNKNGFPSEFKQLGNVFSGLSNKDLKDLQERFRQHWKDSKPSNIEATKVLKVDKWLAPKDSVILQVRASELLPASSYPLGFTMRFPRILKIRYDKPWYSATSTTELLTIYKEKRGQEESHSNTGPPKLTKRKAKTDDLESGDSEKEPKTRKVTPVAGVCSNFLPSKIGEIKRLSRLFEGKEFCVINGNDELNKSQIEKILLEHAAKVVQNPSKTTFSVLVGDPNKFKAKIQIERANYDIVKLDWLIRAVKQENLGKMVEFQRNEMYAVKPSTSRRLQNMDICLNEDLDEEGLKRFMDTSVQMKEELPVLSEKEMKALDKEMFNNNVSPFSVFRGMIGYFLNKNDMKKYRFLCMAGKVSMVFDETVQYVFVDQSCLNVDLQSFKENMLDRSKKKCNILKSEWINDCFKDQKLLPFEQYTA